MRRPIRSQILLPVLLLLLAVAAISLWTGVVAARQARLQIEERLRTVARFLVEESQFPLATNVLRMLRPLSGAEYLLVPTMEPRRTSLDLDPELLPTPQPVAEDWHTLHLDFPVQIDQQRYLCGGILLRRRGDILYIFYPESLWRDAQWQAIRPSILLGSSLGLAALVLAIVQASRMGRRVQDLELRTRQIARGDFSPMPLPVYDDEIRDLAHSINEMTSQLAQLQKAVHQTERLRLLGQVSGGLAHQMRNGLTGARLAVQLFLRELSADVDTSPLEVALRQLSLLETHVKRFLDLGRAEPVRKQRCNFISLIQQAIDLLTPQLLHANIHLTWNPPTTDIFLQADAGSITTALFNLLNNAVEAAGPGGEVGVGLVQEGSQIEVRISDNGPGPPEEIAHRLFEPFLTGKPEGVGLGLAMARQVVESHGGSIRWMREENRTVFLINLPIEIE